MKYIKWQATDGWWIQEVNSNRRETKYLRWGIHLIYFLWYNGLWKKILELAGMEYFVNFIMAQPFPGSKIFCRLLLGSVYTKSWQNFKKSNEAYQVDIYLFGMVNLDRQIKQKAPRCNLDAKNKKINKMLIIPCYYDIKTIIITECKQCNHCRAFQLYTTMQFI